MSNFNGLLRIFVVGVFTVVGASAAREARADCGACCASTAQACGKSTITDVARSAGQFQTLLAALEAAGLTETLAGDGAFTVFAPTDKAFAQLPAGTVEDLLKPENREKLQGILKYHVVPGALKAEDVVKLKKANTAEGGSLRITKSKKEGVRVNKAKILQTDIVATNGVIHVIDSVLLPAG
jgi:transforming growth factor-beta-induced protein